jgi:hypothetical protein
MLVRRLKTPLCDIFPKMQSVFQTDRGTTNNVLVSYERVHKIKNKITWHLGMLQSGIYFP